MGDDVVMAPVRRSAFGVRRWLANLRRPFGSDTSVHNAVSTEPTPVPQNADRRTPNAERCLP